MTRTVCDPSEAARELKALTDRARRMVFFGGAGVSTASGIPDFRSSNGLYNSRDEAFAYPPEVMLSHTFYEEHPEEFFDFYRSKMVFLDAQPNQAHRKLAELERAGHLAAVVTQNVDGLHQAAGSRTVYELHGSVHRNACQSCGAVYDAAWVLGTKGVPICPACGGRVKPDVVLYEEPLDESVLLAAVQAIAQADALVVGGTSLAVYPAAGLVGYFQGDALAVVNRDATPLDRSADLVVQVDIAQAFAF